MSFPLLNIQNMNYRYDTGKIGCSGIVMEHRILRVGEGYIYMYILLVVYTNVQIKSNIAGYCIFL